MSEYEVMIEGYVVVDAETKEEAEQKANEFLKDVQGPHGLWQFYVQTSGEINPVSGEAAE